MKRFKKGVYAWTHKPQQRYRHRLNERKGGIYCPLCKFCTLSLGSHLYYAHHIDALTYRREKGLKRHHQLTADCYHINRVERGKKNVTVKSVERTRLMGKEVGKRSSKNYIFSDEQKEEGRQRIKALSMYLPLGRSSETARKKFITHPELRAKFGNRLNAPLNREKMLKSIEKYRNTSNPIRNILNERKKRGRR